MTLLGLGAIYLALSFALLINVVGLVAPRVYGSALGTLGAIPFIVMMMLAPHILLLGLGLTAAMAFCGVLGTLVGQLGLGLHLIAWAFLVTHLVRLNETYPLLDGRPIDDTGPIFEGETRRSQLAISYFPYFSYRTKAMAAVKVHRSIVYRQIGKLRLRLDVYLPARHRAHEKLFPSIMYIHGGGWVIGTRRQSPFMMYELAAAGYAVFAIQYRLAPRNPLPAAIIDCKAAVAWLREHAIEYQASPDAVVIGGSAGAHLASLVALSPSEPRFQPGFEQADTHVRGAVLLYGMYDFVEQIRKSRRWIRLHWFFESIVFGASYDEKPDLFHSAQPNAYLMQKAPPTLLVHGLNDSLVSIEDSRTLHRLLKQAGARTHLCEVPLAQHAFEITPSPLHQRTMRIIEHFLATLPPTEK